MGFPRLQAREDVNRSLQISDGSFVIFLSRPLSLLLVIAFVLVLFVPVVTAGSEKETR